MRNLIAFVIIFCGINITLAEVPKDKQITASAGILTMFLGSALVKPLKIKD